MTARSARFTGIGKDGNLADRPVEEILSQWLQDGDDAAHGRASFE
jgi:hypothetical protein